MKLSDWAREHSIPYKTAWQWFRNGNLPVPARQLKSGTILVDAPHGPVTRPVVAYARGGSSAIVDNRVGALVRYATSRGLAVTHVITEILSDDEEEGRKFVNLLTDTGIDEILVVEGTYVRPSDSFARSEAFRKLTIVPRFYA